MAVALYNPSSEAGLKKLDEFLISRTYITGGVSGEGSGVTVEGSAPASEVATPPAADSKASAADDDDDDIDLFGEETEEEKAAAEKLAAAKKKPSKKEF